MKAIFYWYFIGKPHFIFLPAVKLHLLAQKISHDECSSPAVTLLMSGTVIFKLYQLGSNLASQHRWRHGNWTFFMLCLYRLTNWTTVKWFQCWHAMITWKPFRFYFFALAVLVSCAHGCRIFAAASVVLDWMCVCGACECMWYLAAVIMLCPTDSLIFLIFFSVCVSLPV